LCVACMTIQKNAMTSVGKELKMKDPASYIKVVGGEFPNILRGNEWNSQLRTFMMSFFEKSSAVDDLIIRLKSGGNLDTWYSYCYKSVMGGEDAKEGLAMISDLLVKWTAVPSGKFVASQGFTTGGLPTASAYLQKCRQLRGTDRKPLSALSRNMHFQYSAPDAYSTALKWKLVLEEIRALEPKAVMYYGCYPGNFLPVSTSVLKPLEIVTDVPIVRTEMMGYDAPKDKGPVATEKVSNIRYYDILKCHRSVYKWELANMFTHDPPEDYYLVSDAWIDDVKESFDFFKHMIGNVALRLNGKRFRDEGFRDIVEVTGKLKGYAVKMILMLDPTLVPATLDKTYVPAPLYNLQKFAKEFYIWDVGRPHNLEVIVASFPMSEKTSKRLGAYAPKVYYVNNSDSLKLAVQAIARASVIANFKRTIVPFCAGINPSQLCDLSAEEAPVFVTKDVLNGEIVENEATEILNEFDFFVPPDQIHEQVKRMYADKLPVEAKDPHGHDDSDDEGDKEDIVKQGGGDLDFNDLMDNEKK